MRIASRLALASDQHAALKGGATKKEKRAAKIGAKPKDIENGAVEWIRTTTVLLPPAPQAGASASSATTASWCAIAILSRRDLICQTTRPIGQARRPIYGQPPCLPVNSVAETPHRLRAQGIRLVSVFTHSAALLVDAPQSPPQVCPSSRRTRSPAPALHARKGGS